MESHEFKVGTKFKYMGGSYPIEYDKIQTVTQIIVEDGSSRVYTEYTDFTVTSNYANKCVLVENINNYKVIEIQKVIK